MNCDLIEAIEYSFGKEIHGIHAADVIITISQDNLGKKFQRCRRAGTSIDEYLEYENDGTNVSSYAHILYLLELIALKLQPRQMEKAAYLQGLQLTEKYAVVISRNGISELAASSNMTLFLERLFKPMERMAELKKIRTDIVSLKENLGSLRKYMATLRKWSGMHKEFVEKNSNVCKRSCCHHVHDVAIW